MTSTHFWLVRLAVEEPVSTSTFRLCNSTLSWLSFVRNHMNHTYITNPVSGMADKGRIHHQCEIAKAVPSKLKNTVLRTDYIVVL